MSISALKEKFNSLTLESENHWDYRGNNNSERDYVHGFCTYPAMMVPKMQREMLDVCLEHLQDTSIRLLDPFAGSGTILVEGMLRGLNIVGIDINPLAILLCKAKTTILNPTTLHEKTVQLFAWITIHDKTPLYKFDGINKWFTNQAISDLSRIRAGIIAEETIEYRRFFWASFCEVVRIVSNSRDCTYKLHIKEKKDIDAYAVDAVDLFKTTLQYNIAKYNEFYSELQKRGHLKKNGSAYKGQVKIVLSDSIAYLNHSKQKYSLVFTSPPYGDFFDLRNDSVIGCVYLTGVANSVLKETTNREGFVEDEYFRAFKSILDGSIKRINRNRKKLNDFMKRYVVDSIAFSGNPSSDVLNYKPAIEQIREDLRTVDASVAGKSAHINVALKEYKTAQGLIADAPFIPLETVSKIDEIYGYIQAASDDYQLLLSERDAIGKKLDAINLDFEKMSERLQDLFELAGLGLSVEMFTHEFDSSIRSVRQKNQQIVSNRAAQTVDNLVRHINYVTYSLDALRKQMSYFNPGLKFVRAEKQIFSFKEFIKTHKSFYIERCKNKNIEFYVDVSRDFDLRLNRGMLNQVFDNLFSNAEYWLDYSAQQGLIENKQYHISAIERGIMQKQHTNILKA